MTLSADAEKKLDALEDRLRGFGKYSHRGHDNDFMYALEIFIDRYQAGEELHPDDVSAWAKSKGWDEEPAKQLGRDADAVVHAMKVLHRKGLLSSQ
jgi:hypothetical protein